MTTTRNRRKTAVLYVSPEGSDKCSGKSPVRRGRSGPFATLARARDAVRKLKRGGELRAPVKVVLRGGDYTLTKPLRFGPEDSGALHKPVVYEAYPGETPVLSGGAVTDNFREDKLNGRRLWVADLPAVKAGKWSSKQLWVNGQRRARPRLPRKGFYQVAKVPGLAKDGHSHTGQDNFVYHGANLKNWRNLRDVEIVLFHYWVDEHFGVKRLDERARLVTLDRTSRMRLTEDSGSLKGAQYYVENVFEALRDPGEWYLDRRAGKLYYMPLEGETLGRTKIVAPRLAEVLRVQGTKTRKAEQIHFRGIAFSHAEWNLPPQIAVAGQASSGTPGSVVLANAEFCSFGDCEFSHLGGYGVEVLDGCADVQLRRSRVLDIAAGGVKIWHGSKRTTVADCEIAECGRVYMSGVGVLVGNSGANKIIHNHIHHLYYSGVSVGWRWGYQTDSQAFGNIVEHNHIHDIGLRMLTDMGGIYTLGVSTGTRLRFNLIHDVYSRTYGGWGIYLDEGSENILVEKNIVYNTRHSGYFMHYGKLDVIQNNIFAFGDEYQIGRGRVEAHNSFFFRRNIVYYRTGKLFIGDHVFAKEKQDMIWLRGKNRKLKHMNFVFENNVYYNAARRPMTCDHRSFAEWKKLGHDRGTIVADPLFRNPDKFDFRLKKGSPAFKVGFEPFELTDVGCRKGKRAGVGDLLSYRPPA